VLLKINNLEKLISGIHRKIDERKDDEKQAKVILELMKNDVVMLVTF
jgi:hypothetical protein